ELTKQAVTEGTVRRRKRKCLFYYTCAVNTENIRRVLEGCRNFLLEDHLERNNSK
ncbi:Guanine nucleotide-binding protein G(S) subunit alpha, partial [Fasciolopsis buskii]